MRPLNANSSLKIFPGYRYSSFTRLLIEKVNKKKKNGDTNSSTIVQSLFFTYRSSSILAQKSIFFFFFVQDSSAKAIAIQRRDQFRLVMASSSSSSQNSNNFAVSRRKVVEHICLIKAKEELSEEQEKNMLDYLYTSQYHMSGIVAISLGRNSDKNKDGYTHAVYMRFRTKEDLSKYYENPSFTKVLKEQVFPHCNELLYVDFESQVEDDMMLIFRKGEEFNSGVEFVLLIEFMETALDGDADEALVSLENLIEEYPNLIVQSNQGCNFNSSNKEYTHGVVIRFRSVDAMEIFMASREYKRIWSSKLLPISQKTLSVYYSVDPIGNQIM
ncbi:hypothetical protein V2J09_014691 [Rumex salicifolius]